MADDIAELHDGERSWQDIDEELARRISPAAISQLRKDTLELITSKSRAKT